MYATRELRASDVTGEDNYGPTHGRLVKMFNAAHAGTFCYSMKKAVEKKKNFEQPTATYIFVSPSLSPVKINGCKCSCTAIEFPKSVTGIVI